MKDVPLANFTYDGDGYTFKFKNERECFYSSIIVKPRHLTVLTNQTELPNSDLKERIINEWFAIENEQTRITNNAKRRAKKQKAI